jgi:hypothetical protein
MPSRSASAKLSADEVMHPNCYARGTDRVPEQAAWPEVTVDIGVGQIRAIDFVANAPGDWAAVPLRGAV